MPSMKQTTVVLTEKAQAIKEDLAPLFGLKNILSAGLALFGKLTSDEQKKTIAEANSSLEVEPLQNPEEEFRKRVRQVLDELEVLPAKQRHGRKAKTSKSA